MSPTFMPEGGAAGTAERNADLAKYVFAPLRARWQQQSPGARCRAAGTARRARSWQSRRRAQGEIIPIMKRGGVQFVPAPTAAAHGGFLGGACTRAWWR